MTDKHAIRRAQLRHRKQQRLDAAVVRKEAGFLVWCQKRGHSPCRESFFHLPRGKNPDPSLPFEEQVRLKWFSCRGDDDPDRRRRARKAERERDRLGSALGAIVLEDQLRVAKEADKWKNMHGYQEDPAQPPKHISKEAFKAWSEREPLRLSPYEAGLFDKINEEETTATKQPRSNRLAIGGGLVLWLSLLVALFFLHAGIAFLFFCISLAALFAGAVAYLGMRSYEVEQLQRRNDRREREQLRRRR